MRKIKILFSIVFLLFFISFFSQKSFADTCSYTDTEAAGGTLPISQAFTKAFNNSVSKCQSAWTTAGNTSDAATNNCTTISSSYQAINADASTIAGSNAYAASIARNKYCTPDPNSRGYVTNCTITLSAICPTSSTTTTTTTTADSGTQATIDIGQPGCSFKLDGTYTQIIACKNGGICAPTPYGKTNTSTTPSTFENGICVDTGNECPVCDSGYQINFKTGKCASINDPSAPEKPIPTTTPCPAGKGCNIGVGCSGGSSDSQVLSACPKGVCDTAIGSLPTNLPDLLTRVFSIVLAIAGVTALGLIIASGYRLMVSQGNPEQVKGVREQLTAAIIGLLFIIFSLLILQVIGHNILSIPGFG